MDTVTRERERWVGKGHSWESPKGIFCCCSSWTPPCFPGRCILASPPASHWGFLSPTRAVLCAKSGTAHPPERLMLWYCTNLPHGAKSPPKPPVMNFRSSLSCY